MAPEGDERVGDVSNVLFSNGWIADDDGTVFIYYGASDTRLHVATTTIDKLMDYAVNTPPDRFTSAQTVRIIKDLIEKNQEEIAMRTEYPANRKLNENSSRKQG